MVEDPVVQEILIGGSELVAKLRLQMLNDERIALHS
jgi:hypothetical protein